MRSMMAEQEEKKGNGTGNGIRVVNVQVTQEQYERIVKAKEKTGLPWREWLLFVVERTEKLE